MNLFASFSATMEESDFLGFSYGFRPRRSQHDALDALAAGGSADTREVDSGR